MKLLTIGFTKKGAEKFFDLLSSSGVRRVVDVRLNNVSQLASFATRDVISAVPRRIDRDPRGIPIKLYPFTRAALEDAPAMVVIDPAVSAGRPVIAGTGLATQVIAERYKAGESLRDLARDYERKDVEIEEAIRCDRNAPKGVLILLP